MDKHLSVNVDYIAVVRESRQTVEPDPVLAAGLVEIAGAHGITCHLREDRRHIQDRDLRLLREVVQLPLNLEMAATEEMLTIAEATGPEQVTFVPEKREEVTTEGGLDVAGNIDWLRESVTRMNDLGYLTSMFIDPDPRQIEASKNIGAHCIELHTGEYANAKNEAMAMDKLDEIADGAEYADSLELEVHAGHGLTYKNIVPVKNIEEISGFYIGHSIMARAMYVGLDRAVKDMITLLNEEG